MFNDSAELSVDTVSTSIIPEGRLKGESKTLLESVASIDETETNEFMVISVSDKNRSLFKKLLSMGIVAGTKVKYITKAPLGGPVNIKALGYQLSLRRSEAEQILVQAV